MLIYFCLIFLAICVLIYILNYINHPPLEKRLKNFKGPKPRFLLGNAHLFSKVAAETTATLMQLSRDYESPMKMKLGPFMIVYIHHPDHVEAALSSTLNIRKTAIDYELVIKEWLGNGLLVSTGETWRSRRKLLTPAFHYGILKDNISVMNEQAEILLDILRDKDKAQDSKSFDIGPLLSSCSLDIICETAMGKTVGAQLDPDMEYVLAVYDATQLIFRRCFDPLLWLPFLYHMTQDGKRMQKVLQILHGFTKRVIRERQISREAEKLQLHEDEDAPLSADSDPKRRKAFLDILLDLKDNGQLTDKDITDEVDTFMFEGHDTTAHGMMWTIYCLGRHPDVQQRVRQELQQVVGDSTRIGMEHLRELKYLEQCIKEAMRIYPAVPAIARTVEHDFNLDPDHLVPAGTMLWINFQAMHRNPNVFPDPMTYDPDRFLQDNSIKRSPFSFTPFSAGPRNCIGQKFAMMEIKIVVGQILRNFVVHAIHSQEEMVEAYKLILNPENGMFVGLKPI